MKRIGALVSLSISAVLLAPDSTWAQLRPHRAEYSLRLGTALNATRIGSAVQDIEQGCDGWRIRRELSVDMSLTPSFRVNITSRTGGEEQRGTNGFTWRTVQVLNGTEREVRGTVQQRDGAYRVALESSGEPEQSVLPPLTLMPVAAVSYLVRRLAAGSETFPVLMFGAEAAGAVFLIDVKREAAGPAEATPPSQRHVAVPGSRHWPITMAFSRAGQQDSKPLLSLRGRLFDSGVLDRLVADAGPLTVAAHLQGLHMHDAPTCPK